MKLGSAASSVLAVSLVPILASCASMPEQDYLRRGTLANIQKILVVTSSKDVRVAGDKGVLFTVLGIPFGPAGIGAGIALDAFLNWGIGSAVDAQRSAAVQGGNRKETIAQRLGGHFTRSLSASHAFDTIQGASADGKGDRSPEALSDFDALLRLRVTELSLRPVTQDEMSLFVELSAEMVSLKNGKEDTLLWRRRERSESGEPHTLEFYQTQGIPMLDASLARLSQRLTDDLIYSK